MEYLWQLRFVHFVEVDIVLILAVKMGTSKVGTGIQNLYCWMAFRHDGCHKLAVESVVTISSLPLAENLVLSYLLDISFRLIATYQPLHPRISQGFRLDIFQIRQPIPLV